MKMGLIFGVRSRWLCGDRRVCVPGAATWLSGG